MDNRNDEKKSNGQPSERNDEARQSPRGARGGFHGFPDEKPGFTLLNAVRTLSNEIIREEENRIEAKNSPAQGRQQTPQSPVPAPTQPQAAPSNETPRNNNENENTPRPPSGRPGR